MHLMLSFMRITQRSVFKIFPFLFVLYKFEAPWLHMTFLRPVEWITWLAAQAQDAVMSS